MDFLTFALTFIFGTIVGSFLNVVIYRYNSGNSFVFGRSQCFSCGSMLSLVELIPIMSFVASRGRCIKCRVRISLQYPLVEIITGLMFVAVFLLQKPLLETIFLISVFSTLIVIGGYDLRHQIIPDGLVGFFAGISLLWFLLTSWVYAFNFPYLWTLLAGPMLFFPFWFLWFFSRGRWIGLGDGKLALGIGWFLGLSLGGTAIMLAFWIGALYALIVMGWQRIISVNLSRGNQRLSLQSEIPFGPFLILGVFIVYFTGMNLFDESSAFFLFL